MSLHAVRITQKCAITNFPELFFEYFGSRVCTQYCNMWPWGLHAYVTQLLVGYSKGHGVEMSVRVYAWVQSVQKKPGTLIICLFLWQSFWANVDDNNNTVSWIEASHRFGRCRLKSDLNVSCSLKQIRESWSDSEKLTSVIYSKELLLVAIWIYPSRTYKLA